ncbi:MAG: hypothetical protein ABI810_12955 [Sphingomonas bacterium]
MKLFLGLAAALALTSWLATAQETQDCPYCGPDIIAIGTYRPKIFHIHQGDGDLIIDVKEIAGGRYPLIKAGARISSKDAYAFSEKNGDLTIVFSDGDRILFREFSKSYNHVGIEFANGENWSQDEIRDLANIGSARNTHLYGDGRGAVFDPKGFARTIVSKGGGDTILYNAGYGKLRIDEVDPEGPRDYNALNLGPGLSAAQAKVTKTPKGDILLSFGHGDIITMVGAMARSDTNAHGMQTINFADGTKWTIGDLRYQLSPSVGDMEVTADHFASTISASSLADGDYTQSSITVNHPHKADAIAVRVLNVSQTGNVDKTISNVDLLKMFNCYNGSGSGSSDVSIDWSFAPEDNLKKAFDYLKEGQSVVLDYLIAISDGQGGEIHKHIKITVAGPVADAQSDDTFVFEAPDPAEVRLLEAAAAKASSEFDRPVRGQSTDIYLVLDTSPSMLLPTSAAGISAMIKATASKSSRGCAYACHEQNPQQDGVAVHDRHGATILFGPDGKARPAPDLDKCEQALRSFERYECRKLAKGVGGTYADPYWAARHYGSLFGGANIPLRIDAETDAARALMGELGRASRRPDTRLRLQVFGFGEGAPTPLTSAMTDASKLRPAAFPVLAEMQPKWDRNGCRLATSCNDDMATDFKAMLAAMMVTISAGGHGSGAHPARKLMLLVTDGMADEPKGKRRWVRELSPDDLAQCEALKAKGVRIAIVYLEYPPVALVGDAWSEAIVGPHMARIEPALQKCASRINRTPLVVKAGLGHNIPEALRLLFRRSVASPPHAR